MELQGAVLEPASNAFEFTIYHRDESGKPDKAYHPEHGIATCVVNSINICRGMLRTSKVRGVFIRLTKDYCEARPNVWFLKRPYTEAEIAYHTDTFLYKVLNSFPRIFVDESLKNPMTMGVHIRRQWDEKFEISKQYILLNGLRLQHMLGAAICASTSQDKDDIENQDHRAFLFMFANVILHEIGHVFLTYLTKGNQDTPPSMRAYVTGVKHGTKGEFGRDLEQLVFGGTLTFWRDPITGTRDNRCGTPYLNTEAGWYRIKREIVDKTVKSDFEFPYDHSGIDESHAGLVMLGFDQPADIVTNPLDHPDWPELRDAPRPKKP